MNTWSARAAIGLGLTLAIASGCSGDSDKTNDGGNRDAGFKRDLPIGRDTTSGQPCVYDGQTYQPGESFTYDCVRFTCQGGNNVIQIGGSPCSDGGPDTRPANDVLVNPDRPADDGDGNRDVAPAEAGRSDIGPPVDVGELDVGTPDDTAPPEVDTATLADTAPPTGDVASEDLPPPVQCIYGGQKYGVGVPFACGCNTCTCDDTGTVVLVTHNDCTIDAG
jgi:hypothetical protein